MEKKIFWATFTVLGIAADLFLPTWFAAAAIIPIAFISWWLVYLSDWF